MTVRGLPLPVTLGQRWVVFTKWIKEGSLLF